VPINNLVMLHVTQEWLKWLTYSLKLMLLFHSHFSLALYPMFTVLHHTLSQCLAKQVYRTSETIGIITGMKNRGYNCTIMVHTLCTYDSVFLINYVAEAKVYNEHF